MSVPLGKSLKTQSDYLPIMPSIEILITFTVAALIMNLSPAPSNLYMMARAIAHGIKGCIVAALGLHGSCAATVIGLSAVFKHSPKFLRSLNSQVRLT
jgi:threonine/homoserine/homoserine lactone efflux protein